MLTRKGGDRINRYEDVENRFDAYCKRVLKNRLIDYKREEAIKREQEISLNLVQEADLVTADNETIVVMVEDEECIVRDEDLLDALNRLPEEKYKIVMCYYYLGMTDKEISQKLEQKRTTVRNKRYRAIYILRKILGGAND